MEERVFNVWGMLFCLVWIMCRSVVEEKLGKIVWKLIDGCFFFVILRSLDLFSRWCEDGWYLSRDRIWISVWFIKFVKFFREVTWRVDYNEDNLGVSEMVGWFLVV